MAPSHSWLIRFARCGDVWENTSIDKAASQQGFELRLAD